MFARQEFKRLREQSAKRNPLFEVFSGVNRRAISMFPGEGFADSSRKLYFTKETTIREQLINIEADGLTCCVKIESPRFKSRSALLILKGRVLACVYGSLKLPNQIFGWRAYERLMTEITHSGNIFVSYVLPEKLVLAAGSMFHDKVFNATKQHSPIDAFNLVQDNLAQLDLPGSIAIVDETAGPVCLLYFADRKIMGIHSFHRNISLSDVDMVVEYLKKHPNTQVLSSIFNFLRYPFITQLTFSLSGLDGREHFYRRAASAPIKLDVASLTLIKRVRPFREPYKFQKDRFIKGSRGRIYRLKSGPEIHNPFQIDPV